MLEHQRDIPFLVNFAMTRSQAPTIGGHYSQELDMWVDDEHEKPMIEFSHTAELVTKTKVQSESDDESLCALELLTKTFVSPESDDDLQKIRLHELMTKTSVELESDDEGFGL
ncbi:hypothetical protein BFX35_01795 [Vibrio cholerae]|jgi:hypothetical protein|nr:hypothetical protein AAY52_16225 [Vibrio metoecus]MBY7813862.1 hypothetical protein [Vibrio fluvialis]OFJ35215.1 hypothetical protein BFX35_01795 [Vibrio cholerae]